MKNTVRLLFFLLLSAINFNLIIKNIDIAVGGTQGIALLIYKNYNINPFIMILSINIVMFILSVLFLSKETTKSIIISTFIYPLFIKITSYMPSDVSFNIIFLLLGGLISGYTTGSIIKIGCSTGGINVLIILLKDYFKIPLHVSNLIINSTILLSSISLLGIKSLIYSIIVLIISSLVIKILNKNVNHCQTESMFIG